MPPARFPCKLTSLCVQVSYAYELSAQAVPLSLKILNLMQSFAPAAGAMARLLHHQALPYEPGNARNF
jgi:hypothetical protein